MAQQFRTLPVPPSLPAVYQISIRAPGQAFAELSTYTFPLSPSSLRVERDAMSSYSETQGPPSQQGVTRVVDTYGLTPPMFVVEGTTGWDRHLSDGYILTGLQSIHLLGAFLARYAQLNQVQRTAGNPNLYVLEFYDYFGDNFWQIEPVGAQVIRQSADRPLLTYYRFQWAGVRPVGLPVLGLIDAVARTLGTSPAIAALNAASTLGAMLTAYAPTGAVAVGLALA